MWKYIPCAIPFASAVLGIAGLPAHLKGWAEWIDVIDHVALWYTLAGASLVAAFGMAVWDWRQTRLRYFDIPILDAVNHLIQTEPHSYGQWGGRTSHVSLAPRGNVLWEIASHWKKGRDRHAKAHQRCAMQAANSTRCRYSTQPCGTLWDTLLAIRRPAGGVSWASHAKPRLVSPMEKRREV